MHRLLSTALLLAWGLWFGAIVMVFVTVTSLFATFADQRQVAGAAAAGVFRRFEALELLAAPVALLAAVLLRRRAAVFLASHVLIALLSLATLGAISSRFLITPRIDELRRQGVPATSPQFKTLHRTASGAYSAQAVFLLAAGTLIPDVIGRSRGELPRRGDVL